MTTAATAPTVDELIERVRGLEPLVEEHRARLDEERAIPGEITSELVDAGLFRLFTPAEFGGHQLDPVSGLRVIAEVARLDGSVGWNVMLLASYSAFAGRCPANAARAIYEPRDSAVAGQISPAGATARVEDGGYRVNGRWPFGSGSGQSTWFVGHCRIEPDGDVEEDAPPRMVWAFTPAANVEIHDTWYTGGLRGTASHEYSMERRVRTRGLRDRLAAWQSAARRAALPIPAPLPAAARRRLCSTRDRAIRDRRVHRAGE